MDNRDDQFCPPHEPLDQEFCVSDEEMQDLAEMLPPENLLAVIGFGPKHNAINHELLQRVIHLLGGEVKVSSYGINDHPYYGDRVSELIKLEVGDVQISIDVVTPKKKG